ncbi:MAG TPA: hypothetical protein P5205_03360 [Candidatus Paceibacterota bacterium]|nr:hypothetical protein [Verrucomicrobiota bacterium]HSA09388.1 hypothetical protein [Candidatus Paceibacterota bacterium]
MANEPVRPIERLLQAAAKKRRDEAGAPFELHPATRRLLQGEVTRQFAKARPEARPTLPLLARLWPRCAWAMGIFAVLAVAVWLSLPPPDKASQVVLLTRNAPEEQALQRSETPPLPSPAPVAPASEPAVAPEAAASTLAHLGTDQAAARRLASPAPSEAPLLANGRLAADTGRDSQDKVPLASTLIPSEREAAVGEQKAFSDDTRAQGPTDRAGRAFQQRYGLAASPTLPARAPAPLPPAPVATMSTAVPTEAAEKSAGVTTEGTVSSGYASKSQPSTASADHAAASSEAKNSLAKSSAQARKEARSGSGSQRFLRVSPDRRAAVALADRAEAAQSALASFEVEQVGQQLRITDEDGSVYTGYMRPGDSVRRSRAAKLESPAAAPAARTAVERLEPSEPIGVVSQQPLIENYSFRVVGTNRTLRQKLVFTGNLTRQPSAATSLAVGSRLVDARSGAIEPGVVPLLNTHISGKVVIGSGRPVEVNAVPAAP